MSDFNVTPIPAEKALRVWLIVRNSIVADALRPIVPSNVLVTPVFGHVTGRIFDHIIIATALRSDAPGVAAKMDAWYNTVVLTRRALGGKITEGSQL